jgi:hypothetical protein
VLRAARTPARQARAAGVLAAAARAAAGRLRAVPAGPRERRVHRAVVRALDDVARGYRALARAARAADTRAYARATARVKRGERALRRGIAALDALGYAVASRGS